MVSQASQIDANVNLYFVVPSKYDTENDCTDEMWIAYNKCCEHDLEPEWITEINCNKVEPAKNDVFIMEEFEGQLFEKLKTYKCSRIVGPRCLSICFTNGEPIPEGTSPVFTTAMRGVCVCASGLTADVKEHIGQLIEYMGGFFTKQLRSCVTHLVTESVMSAKYESAIDMKIPVVTKDWVEAVWKINLKEFVKADDSIFAKYRAPVFLNLVVTSTSLPKRQKDEIKQLINDHGGTFMGPLDGSKVKVVLAPENSPMSEKLKYAKQANIACLKPSWVYDSIKVGYALPFKNFLINSVKACSTPEKPNAFDTLNCSAISSIQCDVQQNNYVDDSLASVTSNYSTIDSAAISVPNAAQATVFDRLTFSEAKLAGPFLDGCSIYLAGFSSNHRDKLNRILNVGSATRLDDISDALSHVIVGNENKASAELKLIKSKGLGPYVLTLEWLEESMKLKRPAPEENFLYEETNNTLPKNAEPPSPLSKKNLQMLQKPRRPPIPAFNIDKKMTPLEKSSEPDLVQQYLQETVVSAGEKTMQEFMKSHISIQEENKEKTLIFERKNMSILSKKSSTLENPPPRPTDNDSALPISQMSSLNDRLFEGLTFVITGFNDEDNYMPETIISLGGEVVSSTFGGIPDFGVVPKCGALLKHTVNEIVTDLFIEDCTNQEQVVDIMYYHRPLSIKKHTEPLSGCVITMSMYTGAERTYLATLATELGAICQDIFARKTNLEKNTYGSTHLVCPTPEGNKYNAAVKWKLPAVTAEWLLSCANKLERVNEEPFLVGETIAPAGPPQVSKANTSTNNSNASTMAPPAEPAPRNIITPKRLLPPLQSQESGDTPLINKRLSLVMNKTPDSPFHVSTPETPYGQVFKPNPSPETRKGWLKWANNFPDLRVEEPPLKRRAPSTPLSELKRQLWQKVMKDLGQNEEENNDVFVPHQESLSSAVTPKNDNTVEENHKSDADNTPISRKLEYPEETSPLQNNVINFQIAQLDQVLQKTSSTPENRYSLSGENAKSYNAEPADHIQKCIIKDSQPIDAIVWEDPSHSKRSTLLEEFNKSAKKHTIIENAEEKLDEDYDEEEEEEEEPEPQKKRFMISGLKDRTIHEEIIRKLGGEVSLIDNSFDDNATHLVCMRPSRNEKTLGSIASGKWVLHCRYIEDSEKEGRFLDEEKYEWGNPKSKGFIPEPNGETEQAIAAAVYKWRLKMLKEPVGPFDKMVALLLAAGEKYDQFKRLIEAGGGQVVQARPPYDTSPSGRKITHCFVNIRQVTQPIDWAMLASKGILCFLPQYLSDHLIAQSPLNPRECVLPEFRKYLTLLPK